jgi:hypothetical protein
VELQADEIKTIVGGKKQQIWVFAVIEVWSRLWPSTVVGKRSYQNTLALFRNVSSRMTLKQIPLIVTDGFGFYEKVIGRFWASVSLWSGDQDSEKRSHREGGAKSGAWGWVEIGTGAARLGGLSETQHVVCRTTESHDPTRLGVS